MIYNDANHGEGGMFEKRSLVTPGTARALGMKFGDKMPAESAVMALKDTLTPGQLVELRELRKGLLRPAEIAAGNDKGIIDDGPLYPSLQDTEEEEEEEEEQDAVDADENDDEDDYTADVEEEDDDEEV